MKGFGGAISSWYNSIVEIIDNNFTRNMASLTGRALWAFFLKIPVSRCLFIGNRANVFGGSLYIEGKSLLIELNKFMNNSGAIFVQNTELKSEICTFEENVATHKGGAIGVNSDSLISIVVEAMSHYMW